MIRFSLAAMLMLTGASLARAADTPATVAYKQASNTMMMEMNQPYTGDADRDFVTGMLPHHQGAVDMAQVERRFGRDPALRRLAREIVASQTKEQAFMRRWLWDHAPH